MSDRKLGRNRRQQYQKSYNDHNLGRVRWYTYRFGIKLFDTLEMSKKIVFHTNSGFSMIEALVVIGLASFAYLFFFRIVTIFLQTRGENLVRQDILTTSDNILQRFHDTAQNASKLEVSGDGYKLQVTGNPCVLMKFNPATKSLGYGENTASNCTPPSSTSASLNTSPVDITELTFAPIASASTVKSVRLTFTVFSQRPFATHSASYASAITLWKQ